MLRLFLLGCLVLPLLGCSKDSGPSPASRQPVNGVVPPLQPEPHLAWDQVVEPPAETLYAGQPVTVWVEQFQDSDPAVRAKAASALGQMGKAGFRPLLEGLSSRSDDTRILALQSVTEPMLTDPENKPKTFPLLMGMLADANPDIRRQAADRLAWFFGRDHLGPRGPSAELVKTVQSLRLVMQNDPDLTVRQVAESAINSITSRVTGLPVAGSPDDPKLPF